MNRKLWLCMGLCLAVQMVFITAPLNRLECQEQPKVPGWVGALGAKAYRDLAYVTDSKNPAQTLDLYLPSSSSNTSGKPLPLIVWVHGGGWREGSKEGGPCVVLVKAGYAVASINYRLSQEAIFPAQIHDVKAAVRFLRANAIKYNLDPGRIGAWGASAGGHLVALLGTSGGAAPLEGTGGNQEQSSRVQAVCDFFGPTDFTTMGGASGTAQPAVVSLLGESPAANRDKALFASPMHYVSVDAPPFLIIHGDKDQLVPLSQSQELDGALKKCGVKSELYVVAGGNHGLRDSRPTTNPMVIAFFNHNLQHVVEGEEKSAQLKQDQPSAPLHAK